MTDKDDILIRDFFKQAAQQQIEDNGFTERVMEQVNLHHIPEQSSPTRSLCRLWTWFCIAVGGVLFYVLNGWEALKVSLRMLLSMVVTSLEVFVTTVPTADLRLSPVQVLLLVGFVAVYLPYQTARRLSSAL